ncbi:MAG: hypothetical protein QNJ89_11675 [Acidimicrobiia bacterium]|nr:hypothetical protein [Acidimicrobiia bacterium]
MRPAGSRSPAIAVDPAVPPAVAKLLATPGGPGADHAMIRIGPPAVEPTWWWLDSIDSSTPPAPPSLEAILVPDERTREELENRQPPTIGRVWVAPDAAEQRDALVDHHYPVTETSYRLGLIGYNLKFAKPIVADLLKNPHVAALIDEWRVFAAAPTAATDQVLAESDIVWCEWCGPNAVYASRHKTADQRLVVRLHRFELETEHWRGIDHEAVDTFVTVGDYYRNLVLERTEWPADKVVVIPNQIDDLQLARPKVPEARFTLGMLGASSSRKRLDLALDLIEQLSTADERFRLRIKTALPAEEKWVWDNPAERSYFADQLPRLERSPLAGVVTLDPYGTDIASWFRKIGFILSLSDDESFHLAPAEGMAATTVPVIRNWPGADSVYSSEWVFSDLGEMVDQILRTASDEGAWIRAGRRAAGQARSSFARRAIVEQWDRLLGQGPGDTLQ